jgi:hypothetical protein
MRLHIRTLFPMLAVTGLLAASVASATKAEAAAHRFAITRIYFDSPGDDLPVTNYKLNHEWVGIKNITGTGHSLDGYRVTDADGHAHYFGNFTLAAGHTVYLHTGRGAATSTAKYWDSGNYIWNNTSDTATLRNANGTYVDSCAYTSSDDPAKTC